MSDDKRQTVQDCRFVSVHERYELHDGAERLGVTRAPLTDAVAAVGLLADRVRDHLASH